MRLAALLLLLAPTLPGGSAQVGGATSLTVRVACVDQQIGFVRIALFDRPESHLREAVASAGLAAAEGRLVWRLRELPAGDYSLAAYHDRNGNGRLDRRLFGLPAEPYGFSNGLRIRLGPPRWKAARFEVRGETEVTICVE